MTAAEERTRRSKIQGIAQIQSPRALAKLPEPSPNISEASVSERSKIERLRRRVIDAACCW